MSTRLETVSALIAVTLCYSAVACMTTTDVENESSEYCTMVKEGAWPDYSGTYEKECK